ncbi:glycosyl transferase [Pseudorhodoferax sp.]|uniref:glycosyl transferase n=1 Tax=Pseudorhodoferax sp. TaxID=1993553 RepID=UPI002DD68885|nr:glycosyl transferase [Pseudorhodoferax sp.]
MLTVSVVSHGHDRWLPTLLQQLARTGAGCIAEVRVTHNLPPTQSLPAGPWPFALVELHNASPRGFGANHNQALQTIGTPLLAVLNPDITDMADGFWPALVHAVQRDEAGCAFPVLLNLDGSVQDNARAVPTPLALVRRRLLRQPDRRVDWASAACWVMPEAVYRSLGGFDARYFMYCEDVDFCLRLQLAGRRLVPVPAARAVHAAQRSSLRGGAHLLWHLQSLWRLWTSSTLWKYLRSRA